MSNEINEDVTNIYLGILLYKFGNFIEVIFSL